MISAKLYLYFVFFLIYSSSIYINDTFPSRLRKRPYNFTKQQVPETKTITKAIQCSALFLGGLLAVFTIRISNLLIICFLCIFAAIILFDIPVIIHNSRNATNTSENHLEHISLYFVVAFVGLYGVFYGFSRFIMLALLLDQAGRDFIGCTFAWYLWVINLSQLCISFIPVEDIFPPFIVISLPILVLTVILLLIGHKIRLYDIDPLQIPVESVIFDTMSFRLETPILNLTPKINWGQFFAKSCTLFIAFLPFGLCNSQVSMVSEAQSNHMSEPINFPLRKKWSTIFGSMPIIICVPLFGILWRYSASIRRIYSNKMLRLIIGFSLIFFATLTVVFVEIFRKKYQSYNLAFGGKNNVVSKMSIFYLIPQLTLNGLSELLLIPTCGEYMYRQSQDSLRFLSVAFFIGAIGFSGAGGFMSMITFRYILQTYDFKKKTEKVVIFFAVLSAGIFVANILTLWLMWKYRDEHGTSVPYNCDTDESEPLVE